MNVSVKDMEQWGALSVLPPDPRELLPWLVTEVRAFYPFERVVLVHGEHAAGELRVKDVLSHGHCEAYLQQFTRTFDLHLRGCLAWWLASRMPLCVHPDRPSPFATPFELAEIREFRLGRIAAHAVVNARGSAGNYFFFSGVRDAPDAWHVDALKLIAPMLDDLFQRHIAARDAAPC